MNKKKSFCTNSSGENSARTTENKVKVEKLLVEFSGKFAKHRFDAGYNTELKIKLTPEHEKPVYVQSPTTPIHLRDELDVELAVMPYFNLVITLPNSKHSSPVFAQRKSSGKLRILIDLTIVNHLLKIGYTNTNFAISNMSNA